MRTSAERSSAASTTASRTAHQPFMARAARDSFFAPAQPAVPAAVQMKMEVNKPGDKFEREADKMADKVMRLPAPSASGKDERLQRQPEEKLQKAAMPEEKIQKTPMPEE